ncbi:CHASE2 domain-containing protein, partial [bacterium]
MNKPESVSKVNSKHKILAIAILLPITLLLNLIVWDVPPFPVHARNVTNQILLVTLSDADIETLGGWPISRDYFGYMIHALTQSGAKTIGLDFLFDKSDSLFQEYDAALAGFIRTSGAVVLPAIIQSDGAALLPARPFREYAAIGFSNLGEESTIHRLPLTAYPGDSIFYSFGFELARHYLGLTEKPDIKPGRIMLKKSDGKKLDVPIDKKGYFIPDYFGGLDRIHRIGFVELLKTFQDHPDSLNLKGKLILVAPVAQTLPVIKTIPKYGAVPGSLIHLT